MRVTHRLETTEEGRKRVAEVMERQERGKIAKADAPVVDGRPDAEEQAFGEPVREREETPKKWRRRAQKRRLRRSHKVESVLGKVWMICTMSWKERRHQPFRLEHPEA